MKANHNLLKQLRCLVLVPMLGLASSVVIAGEELKNDDPVLASAYGLSPHLFDTTLDPFDTALNLHEKSIVLTAAQAAQGEGAETSADCAKFAGDPDADVGDVIRAGCKPSLAQMSALMDNPLGNVAMLFSQYDFYRLENDANGIVKNQHNYMGIAQFPKKLTEDWNLINRVVWNVPSVPIDQAKLNALGGNFSPGSPGGPGSGPLIDAIGGRTTGFGDMYYVGLFSPSEPINMDGLDGKFLWGLGFDLAFPTGSQDVLTSNKWSAGPSGLAVYLGPDWKIGGLVQQYFSYAGDDVTSVGAPVGDVNLTNLQYFIFYAVDEVSAIGASPNIIMDWEAGKGDKFTVPIGIGYSRTMKFGAVPVRFGLEFHVSVIRPDNVGSEYGVRFYIIPAAPSALFSWMN
jgi:hypothetical protein